MDPIYVKNHLLILEILLTFLGTILAISFSLAVIPVQNILGKYSQELVNRVLKDKIILLSYLFLLLIFVINFCLLFYNSDVITAKITIITGFVSFVVFPFFIYRIYTQIDIRNQITKIGKRLSMGFKKKRIKDSDELKRELDIIIDIALRSIQQDRYEMFIICMEQLAEITVVYVKFKRSIYFRDPYYMYLTERLIDVKRQIKVENHPMFMNHLVQCLGKNAISTLDNKIMNNQHLFMPAAYFIVDDIAKIVLSPEIFKETATSPYEGINQLFLVGTKAVDENSVLTVNRVLQKFEEISTVTSSLQKPLSDFVAKATNEKVILLLIKIFNDRNFLLRAKNYDLEKILKFVYRISSNYYEKIVTNSYPNNLDLFFYPNLKPTIEQVMLSIVRQIGNDKEYALGYKLLYVLEKFFADINQLVILAMKKQYYQDVNFICCSLYTAILFLISMQTKLDEDSRRKSKNIIYERIKYIFSNPISMSFNVKTEKSLFYYEHCQMYTSLLGVLLIEHSEYEVLDVSKWIEFYIKLVEEYKDKIRYYEKAINKEFEIYEIINPLKEVYEHLRLVAFWVYKLDFKIFFERIIDLLKTREAKLIERNSLGFEDGLGGYPYNGLNIVYHGSEPWNLYRPYMLIPEFQEWNEKLFDVKAAIEFEKKYLKKKK